MTPRRDTKSVIIEASLRLFSEHGYEGVGMRDIAEAVGIQPPSLYKHFAGKQAIFDAVVERMSAGYDSVTRQIQMPQGEPSAAVEGYAALTPEMIASMTEAMFRYWTEDEYAVLFRRLLTMEQYRTPQIGELYRSYFVHRPLEYQGALFDGMMQAGCFAPGDGCLMALEFFAPVFLLMQAADGCETQAQRDELAACLRAYVERFAALHANTG